MKKQNQFIVFFYHAARSLGAAFASFLVLLLTTGSVHAQTKEIKGTVTDELGKPMSNVSVTVKGTSKGTVTDTSGAFALQIPGNKTTLVVDYVGYITQEINSKSAA